MSYTTERTWVAAETVTAALLNAHLRDNVTWLATDAPTCGAYNSATQSLTTGTQTTIAMNSERWDNAIMHDLVTNNSRITIPTGGAGRYLVGCSTSWGLSAAGNYRQSVIRLTGATAIATSNGVPQGGLTGAEVAAARMYSFAAADYIELRMAQDSGGNLAAGGVPGSGPEMWAMWVRN